MKRFLIVALLMNGFLLGGRLIQDLAAEAAPQRVADENGDTNGDGKRDLSDAVHMLNWLFGDGAPPVAFAQGGGSDEELMKMVRELSNKVHEMEGEMMVMQGKFDSYDDSIGEAEAFVDQWGDILEQWKNAKRDKFFSFVEVTDNEIAFCGVNVRICNGLRSTQTQNGLGNLIVGYNETVPAGNTRTGSHNVIVGGGHNYWSNSSLAVGNSNSVGAHSVALGVNNGAWQYGSTVTGGTGNVADASYATVSGGWQRFSTGQYDWVAGGLSQGQ